MTPLASNVGNQVSKNEKKSDTVKTGDCRVDNLGFCKQPTSLDLNEYF
jgi:hypothetical protein